MHLLFRYFITGCLVCVLFFLRVPNRKEQYGNLRYADYGDDECIEVMNRRRLKEILLRWIDIATSRNITYMLTYGTLLGSWRNGEGIPYDTDLDIYIDPSEKNKLDEIKDKRDFDTFSEEFHLVLDEDWRVLPANKRRCLTCDGELYNETIRNQDSCTFIGPFGRLIKGYEQYLDIWTFERVNGSIFDGHVGGGSYFLETDIFPLQKCRFMGLDTFCPRNPKVIFYSDFGQNADLRPSLICRNGRWVTREFTKSFPVLESLRKYFIEVYNRL